MPKKNRPKEDKSSSNTVRLTSDSANRPRLIAQLAVTPSLQAASTIKRWSSAVGDLDISGLIDELRQQAATASSGDLKRQEAMLAIQAHTLDTIFNELARRSSTNLGGYLEAADRYMRLALKAQSQCRATIETLAEIKNPRPVAFVNQANIANGPQQVNNCPDGIPARAQKKQKISKTNYWSNPMANGWTASRQAAQSAAIRQWRPWEQSTGPRTDDGKRRVSGNAYRGGRRAEFRKLMRQVRELLREQYDCLSVLR